MAIRGAALFLIAEKVYKVGVRCRVLWLWVPAVVMLTAHCGSPDRTALTAPAPRAVPAPLSVQVTAAADASTTLYPGQTLQLRAVAAYADGTTADITTAAVWQSSNVVAAVVTLDGVVKAAVEGAVDVTATYQNVSGALHVDIQPVGCETSTISPQGATFTAFEASARITVSTSLSDCRWTAASDADWLTFGSDRHSYTPPKSGDGAFTYRLPVNSTPNSRTGHVIVSFSNGSQFVHTVTQDPPVSCIYIVTPSESFVAAEGEGFFDVRTTPGNCRWTATVPYPLPKLTVKITIGASGMGAGRVAYTFANDYGATFVSSIVVSGLSGANPPAIHQVHVRGR